MEQLYARFPFERSFADDPISSVRALATDARRGEVAAILGATLAIGNTTAIRGAIARVADVGGGDVGWFVDPAHATDRARRLAGSATDGSGGTSSSTCSGC